jgi:hypothetical protein
MSKTLKSNNPGASDQVKRPTAPALIKFLDALDADNNDSPNGNWSRVSAETLMQLMGAAQNYYESAIRARTYLFGGLAGGAIIGAGIYGLVSHIQKRRNSGD